jgi:flagellar export protein FliJ
MTSNRLARIVRVKKLVEQARSTELAQSQNVLDRAADSLRQTHEDLQALDDAQTANTPTADQLQAAAAYQGHLERQEGEVRDEVVVATNQVEEDRDRVEEVWRERRLLEDFQDRLIERERLEADSAERRVADDMALNAHIRAGQAEGDK